MQKQDSLNPRTAAAGLRARATADYVLHGRYCEPARIAAYVSYARRAAHAECALLIAWRRNTLFQSLLIADHANAGLGVSMQRALEATPFRHRDNAPPPWLSFDPATHEPALLAKALVVQPPFTAMAGVIDTSERLIVYRSPPDDAPPDGTRVISPAESLLLVVGAPELPAETESLIEGLHYLVNMSTPAVVHGNLDAERDIEYALRRLRNGQSGAAAPPDQVRDSVPQRLLNIALDLTGSTVGSVYLGTRENEHLRSIARRNLDPGEDIVPIADPTLVVSWVHSRGRPMIINDVRDFRRMRPLSGQRDNAAPLRTYAAIAVPVHRSSSGVGEAIGVINIQKARDADGSGDRGHYTYRDLYILRALAYQLGHWDSDRLLRVFSRTHLSGHGTGGAPGYASGDTPKATHSLDLPADALPALPALNRILESVADVTRSATATVRVLSTDQQELVRLAGFPPESLTDPHDRIPIRHPASVNAWVARHGLICNLKHPDDAKLFEPRLQGRLDVGRRTISELCIPVMLSGRLAGTVNLESRHRDAYSDALDPAIAVVEQIGAVLQGARRQLEQEVYSLSIASTANRHQIFGYLEALRVEAETNANLTAIAEGIEKSITIETELPSQALAADELLRQVRHQLHFDELFHLRNKPPLSVRHRGVEAAILRIAFEELMRNGQRAAMNAGLDCWLHWEQNRLGGQRFLCLRIGNSVVRAIDPTIETCLFRTPIDRGDRQHIGAFVAAALMRSIGGEIWIHSATDAHFVARIDIPVAACRETAPGEPEN